MKFKRAIRPIVYAVIIAFFLPNTQQFLGRFSPHFRDKNEPAATRRRLAWRPTPLAAAFVFILLLLVTLEMNRGGEFIYFQF